MHHDQDSIRLYDDLEIRAAEVPDIIQAVNGPAVDIRRIGLCPSGEFDDQSGRVVADIPEASSQVPDAQPSQPEECAAGRQLTAKFNAALLNELTVAITKRQPHQGIGRFCSNGRVRRRRSQHKQRVSVIRSWRIHKDPPLITHTGHPTTSSSIIWD
jgi:hypothetical protein